MSSGTKFTYAQIAKAVAPAKPAVPSLSPAAARQEALRKEQARLAAFNAQLASDALSREKQRDNNAAWAAVKAADKARRAAIEPYIGALCESYRRARELSELRLVLEYQARQFK